MVYRVHTYCAKCGVYKTLYVDYYNRGYIKFKCGNCGYEQIWSITACSSWNIGKYRKSAERNSFYRTRKAELDKDQEQARTLTRKRNRKQKYY